MPSLDALAAPLAMVAIAAIVPQLTGRIVRLVLGVRGGSPSSDRAGDLRLAFGLIDASQMVIAWLAGSRALGPAIVARPDGTPSLFFGLGLAIVAWGSMRLARPTPWPTRTAVGGAVGVGALLGIATSAGLFAGWAALNHGTVITEEQVSRVEAHRARLRLLIDPWDPLATLGFAWASLDADQIPRARSLLRDAEALGAPRERTLALRTALEATDGNCSAAHEAFERWLDAHAARAFEGDRILHETLSLGSFEPPAVYLSRCGVPPAPRASESADGPALRTSPDASR